MNRTFISGEVGYGFCFQILNSEEKLIPDGERRKNIIDLA